MKKYNVCIVGGGSTYTLGFLKSFARMQEEFPLNKLVLFDIDGERQKPIGQYGDIMFAERYPELDFSYTTDPKEAYQDMDFIFMQMRAGGLHMRQKDEHIPLSFGKVGQETCGAGGMAYGLRSCVDMIEAVHQIREYSPEAWILNYSNPAAIVAEALRREFPDDKRILNICDQPENVVRSTSRLLGCDWGDLDPVYFGLNHYGWFTHMYDRKTGEDLLPKIRQIVKEKGFLPQDAEQRDQSWLDTYGFVQTMMEDFPDYLPNTYDGYYLYPEYKTSHLNPEYTRADEVIAGRESRVFKEAAEVIKAGKLGDKFHAISDAHAEMMIKVAEAIAFNTLGRFILIVENNGAIANMQDDAMVEVVCELGINGPRPMSVGNIPQFYLGLLVQQVSCEKLLVDAYYEHSYQKALEAFTLNRLINDATKFDDGYVKQYYGPKSLKEYDTVRYLNGDFIDGDLPVSDVNEANISFDEAKKKAGDFMQAIGIESMIKTGESDCEWEGYNKTEDNVYKEGDVHRAIWGYALEYSLGADDVVYSKSLNVFDYSAYNKFCPMDCPGYETGSFNVNEYGVYRFDIAEPVSIVKKQQKVELLPVSNIYKIARNELESHPDKYIVEADTQYRYLTLGYIRVKDSSDSQRFSYIPAWSLELLQRGEVESCPVFVNAIDGTVIEPEQIF